MEKYSSFIVLIENKGNLEKIVVVIDNSIIPERAIDSHIDNEIKEAVRNSYDDCASILEISEYSLDKTVFITKWSEWNYPERR